MADTFTTAFGYPTAGSEPSINWKRTALDYESDFTSESCGCNNNGTKQSTRNEKSVVLTNVEAPLDQPEVLRYSIENIKDIYSGTGINPSYMSQSKKGFSLLVQLNEIARVTSSTDPSFTLDLPVSVHTVIKAPSNRFITADMLLSLLQRLNGAFFSTSDTTNTSEQLARMIRGSINPLG